MWDKTEHMQALGWVEQKPFPTHLIAKPLQYAYVKFHH